jgi:hypothetical protein
MRWAIPLPVDGAECIQGLEHHQIERTLQDFGPGFHVDFAGNVHKNSPTRFDGQKEGGGVKDSRNQRLIAKPLESKYT